MNRRCGEREGHARNKAPVHPSEAQRSLLLLVQTLPRPSERRLSGAVPRVFASRLQEAATSVFSPSPLCACACQGENAVCHSASLEMRSTPLLASLELFSVLSPSLSLTAGRVLFLRQLEGEESDKEGKTHVQTERDGRK